MGSAHDNGCEVNKTRAPVTFFTTKWYTPIAPIEVNQRILAKPTLHEKQIFGKLIFVLVQSFKGNSQWLWGNICSWHENYRNLQDVLNFQYFTMSLLTLDFE